MDAKGRVLVAKLGLDGHDVGAKVAARLLRDAGFEVVYLGIRQTPEAVVKAAQEEDVDLVGISILSGAHKQLLARLIEQLKERGDDVPVTVAGVIPAGDRDFLAGLGVRAVFDAGTPVPEMIGEVERLVREHRGAA